MTPLKLRELLGYNEAEKRLQPRSQEVHYKSSKSESPVLVPGHIYTCKSSVVVYRVCLLARSHGNVSATSCVFQQNTVILCVGLISVIKNSMDLLKAGFCLENPYKA